METRAYRPVRNIFGRPSAWPKTWSDFALFRSPSYRAFRGVTQSWPPRIDSGQSGSFFSSQSPGGRSTSLACRVVPGHPRRGSGLTRGVTLELREVVEGIDVASSAVWMRLMNRSPTSAPFCGLVEQSILAVEDGFLEGSLADVVVQRGPGHVQEQGELVPVLAHVA